MLGHSLHLIKTFLNKVIETRLIKELQPRQGTSMNLAKYPGYTAHTK